jgi:CubicO group peptidase (beta-lactamase class C family)
VGIVINETLVWAKGYGDQSSLDTVYMLGSILKSVIATAILQLVEDGTMALDDDVNNYLPFELRHPDYPSEPITIQMCLSHRSSLLEFPNEYLLWDRDQEMVAWVTNNLGWEIPSWTPLSLEQYIEQNLSSIVIDSSVWLPNRPGTNYKYSNSVAQILLPYIIQNATGQSHKSYIAENIFSPLEMENSGFNGADFAQAHAKPYSKINENIIQIPDEYYLGNYISSDLRGSLPDLANFMIAHMNEGKYKNFQLLSPESIELMHAKYSSWTYEGNEWSYGLGWVWKFGAQGHGGAVPGFLADFLFKEANNKSIGILYMFNRGSSWVHDEDILSGFQPSLRALLFQEAERMVESTPKSSPGFELEYLIPVFIFVFFSIRAFKRNRKYSE